MNTSPEQKLWMAVLAEQLVMALRERDPGHMGGCPKAARNWIGSSGFRDVCALAGVEAAWVMRMCEEQFALPVALRLADVLCIRHPSTHLSMTRLLPGRPARNRVHA